MAVHAPITTRREVLALLGSTPALAIPCSRRPTSFADALGQYRQARAQQHAFEAAIKGNAAAQLATEDDYDAAVSRTMDHAERVFRTPAPTLSALADKIAVAVDELAVDDIAHLLLADARRLAGAA